MTLDLLACGRVAIDRYTLGPPLHRLGGVAANVAVGLARLGRRAAVISRVGDDEEGYFVRTSLQAEGVDTSRIHTSYGWRTPAVEVLLQPRQCRLAGGDADLQITSSDWRASDLEGARYVLITGTGLTTEESMEATLELARAAQAAGATVILDIDYRAPLWRGIESHAPARLRAAAAWCGMVVGDDAEMALLSDALSPGPTVVVQKHGPKGATIRLADASWTQAGYAVQEVDPMGAGDAFLAALLHARMQNLPWPEALQWGCAAGALAVTQIGAAAGCPDEAAVRTWMTTAAT